MKNIFYIAALLLLFSACKKDAAPITSNTLVGKWKETSGSYRFFWDDTIVYQDTLYLSDSPAFTEFKADGHFTNNFYVTGLPGSLIITGTYNLSADKTILNEVIDTLNSSKDIFSTNQNTGPGRNRGNYNYTYTSQLDIPINIVSDNKFTLTQNLPLYGAYDGPPVTQETVTDKNGKIITYNKEQLIFTYTRMP